MTDLTNVPSSDLNGSRSLPSRGSARRGRSWITRAVLRIVKFGPSACALVRAKPDQAPYGLSVSWRESLKAGVNGWLMAGSEAAA
jgi:hypothetical protein